MTEIYRGKKTLPHVGPYIGRVTNHLDTTLMGSLEVSLIRGLPENSEFQSATFAVKYLSPFYGVTGIQFQGNNASKFDDVQKSYGMWMVPPDIGTQVLVIFVAGDPNQGFWFGCVMDQYQNHMVPGIAASENIEPQPGQVETYRTQLLPVAEFHKQSNDGNTGPSVEKRRKAIHPFADRLLEQGLLLDTIRGVTSSGARREVPSQVFGISTPGPLDSTGTKRAIGYSNKTKMAPVSRLGGTTFVMDDGDINGENELVRLRTRTGHQILMHNTKDLIYIANARGTAWIELTSNGKIDIYAADSVSIHSEQDLNFRADRNINIEAMGNINIAGQDIQVETPIFKLRADRNLQIETEKASINTTAEFIINTSDLKISATESIDIVSETDLKINSNDGNIHINSYRDIFQSSENFNLKANKDGFITAGGVLHQQGAPAKQAEVAAPSLADSVEPLPKFVLPNRVATNNYVEEWKDDFYQADAIVSIMSRVPTHEPYDQHEDINPAQFSADGLDIYRSGGPTSQIPGGTEKYINGIPLAAPYISSAMPGADQNLYSQVTVIGDSIDVSAKPSFEAALGANVIATVGWQTSNMIQALKAALANGSLRAKVSIHLGTNGVVTEAQLKEILELLKDRKLVVVVNAKASRPWIEPNNRLLARIVPEYPNTKLVDWFAISNPRPEFFVADGVHLTAAGISAYVNSVVTAIGPSTLPVDPVPAAAVADGVTQEMWNTATPEEKKLWR